MPIAAMARARAMRANPFPRFVTDDVMCYHSPKRRETRKPLPGTEAACYFTLKSSLCIGAIDGSRQRLLDRSPRIAKGRSIRAGGTRRGEARHGERDNLL